MTPRPVSIALAALLALTACTSARPDPRATGSPSASPTLVPIAATVWCVRGRAPLSGGVTVGGTADAGPAMLAEVMNADTATTAPRQLLARSQTRRERWRRDLLEDAEAGQLVAVVQLGEYQRATAQALARARATIVVALPDGTEPQPLVARYPRGTYFVTTAGAAEDDAELSHAEAAELTGVLVGSIRCAALTRPSPSPSPSVSTTPGRACGPADARRPIRFVVDVERGVSTTPAELTAFLLDVYCDARGWTRTGRVSFATAPRRAAGVTLIRLVNREGVRTHCTRLLGEQASGNYSCASHAANEIVLNNVNWENGTRDFRDRGGSLREYRTMVATHEMGHVLDLRHQLCRTDGAPAPVMMQQSISMTSESTGKTCEPNPWPRPDEIDRLKRRWS